MRKTILALFCLSLSLSQPVFSLTLEEAASEAYQHQDYARALTLHLELLNAQPDNPDLHYRVGTLALLNAEPLLARSHLQKALELQPDWIEALNHLGLAYQALQEPEAARQLYLETLRRRPLARVLWRNLGELELQSAHLDAARQAWKKALLLKDDSALKARLEQLPEALASPFAPAAALAAYRQAVSLEEQGQNQAALKAFQALLKTWPDCVPARFRLARLLLAEKEYPAAQVAFEAVLNQEPEYPAALFERARLRVSAKRLSEAETDLGQVLYLQPDYAPARALLLQLLIARGAKSEALQLLGDWLRLHPEDQESRLQWVEWQIRAGNRSAVKAFLLPLIETHSASAQDLYLVGKLEWQEGQKDLAQERFSQAFNQSPKVPLLAQPEVAEWQSQTGHAVQALTGLKAYLQHNGKDLPALVLGAQLALQEHQPAQALLWLDQARKLKPNLPELDKYFGLAWLQQRKLDFARLALQRYLKASPHAADASALEALVSSLKSP